MSKPCAVLVVQWRGHILILLRAKGGPSPDTFCFPGGNADPGEAGHWTAWRETHEETGLNIPHTNYESLGTARLSHAHIDVFIVTLDQDEVPQVTLSYEHAGHLWVDPNEEWVHQLPFAGRVIRTVLAGLRDGELPSFA